jgi:NADPH:quinone reductase-like Zn-dependent oxidoreductase
MYRKVVAQEFNNYNSIKIVSGSLDELRKGLSKTHSIIKLHASVILFLDSFKFQGLLPTLKAPFTLGSDGSGIIVES